MPTHAPTKPLQPRPAASKPTTADADPTTAPGTSRKGKPLTLATLDTLPPAYAAGESQDAIMGRQLTEQWEKVKSNRKDDLIFGAMMVKVRERVDSARGANSAKRGPGTKGTGLKAWLAEHAPTVSESIAYRMMEIAEGVADDFKLKNIDLEALLSAQVDNLDEKLAKKRLEIEKVIEGKSQRQLLLDFGRAPSKSKGGNQHPKCPHCQGNLRHSLQQVCPHCEKPTGIALPEGYDPQEAEAIDLWTPLLRDLRLEGIDHQSFVHLPDKGEVSRETLRGLLIDLTKALREADGK